MITASIYENKEDTDKKQKYTDAKIENIKKWMEELMNKVDNTQPKRSETKKTKILAPCSTSPG